jgi:hypothetical protein
MRTPRHSVLFFAFAFAVIADPVSSVAYAIEAALRALHGVTWFGHGGRLLFAVMTVAFVLISIAVLVLGFASPHATGQAAATADPGRPAVLAVVLAFPVAMALATGIEAPSTAIA